METACGRKQEHFTKISSERGLFNVWGVFSGSLAGECYSAYGVAFALKQFKMIILDEQS